MDKLEQIKNAVTANGMREWTDERVGQAMREYVDQQNAELYKMGEHLSAENSDLSSQIEGLKYDKERLRERVKELEAQADNQFSVGYCTAVSVLMRSHDQPTIAEDVLNCNFLTLSEMAKIGVDGFDITTLEPIVKEIERKRKL